ncbi:helix-turn-helix transcriptional regulator, partial [Pseudomonas sp. SIMBA_065]
LEVLAEKTGMTKSYLSKVERGLNTPSIAAALKLARALNVNVEELFAEEQTGPSRYSLVRHGERQALVGDGRGPGYAALTSQVGQRSLLPFLIQPPS